MIHQEVQKGINVPFTFERFDRLGQLVPTSGTYDIFDNSGISIQNGSLTIDSVGDMTFTFTSANNTKTGNNFKIALTYVVDSITKNEFILFDVVETPLINLVSDKDLFIHLPIIRDRLYEKNGRTTDTGTTTTIIDNQLPTDERDWAGARGSIVQDSIETEFRVLSYDVTTGTITFFPAVVSTVANEYYSLRESFEDTIDEGFNFTRQDIRNKIGCTAGYIDSNVLKNMTIFRTLEIICNANVEVIDDKWSVWAVKFMDKYNTELSKINEPYDNNSDGNISDTENNNKPSSSIIQVVR